jgi:hypothetical protein
VPDPLAVNICNDVVLSQAFALYDVSVFARDGKTLGGSG